MLERISNQTELDIHIGSIHRKIPFSSCSCYGDVQENILDSCDSCDNNGDSLCIYRTELASSCNICWKTLKTEIELNTHMGSIHGMNISSSCSWNDNAPFSSSLCTAHDKIVIDCEAQPRKFCRKEWVLVSCSEEKKQRHLYKKNGE